MGQLYVNGHKRPGTAAVTGIARQTQNKEPFSVGSQRHELGRLDIQETNEAASQTGTPNQQQHKTEETAPLEKNNKKGRREKRPLAVELRVKNVFIVPCSLHCVSNQIFAVISIDNLYPQGFLRRKK